MLKWGWWWNLWLNNFSWKNLFNQPPTQTYPNKNIRSHCTTFNTRFRFSSFRLFFRACFFSRRCLLEKMRPSLAPPTIAKYGKVSSKIGWKVDHTKITKTILSHCIFQFWKTGIKCVLPHVKFVNTMLKPMMLGYGCHSSPTRGCKLSLIGLTKSGENSNTATATDQLRLAKSSRGKSCCRYVHYGSNILGLLDFIFVSGWLILI